MPINLTGSFPPLFCVYGEPLQLALKLRKQRPVYSLNCAYGADDIETTPIDIHELARIYVADILSVQPAGPYFIYGFCSGATIAYEVAQQLLAGAHIVSNVYLAEPSVNGRGTKETAKLIIQGMRSRGLSVARLKALLSVCGVVLKWAPAFVGNQSRILWHSATGTITPLPLRFQMHINRIQPSVRRYVYKPLGCPVDFFYRNFDQTQTHNAKQLWGQVTGHKVAIHSVKAGDAHMAVLEDIPLETIAAVIDKSLSEATLPKKDVVVN
jgi:thioesterase domain-containing protein